MLPVRLSRRPFRDWALSAGTLVLLGLIRMGLALLPFRILRSVVDQLKISFTAKLGAVPEDRLIWAVKAASRFVPGATCLTQSLTLESLLALHGLESRTCFGVVKTPEGDLKAHAWVESASLLDQTSGVEHFIPLEQSGARTT